MKHRVHVVALFAVLLPCLCATDITVNQVTGTDHSQCLTGKIPCVTLDFVLHNSPVCHNHPLKITILDGSFKFTLNSTMTNTLFQNCPSVSITSGGADKGSEMCSTVAESNFDSLPKSATAKPNNTDRMCAPGFYLTKSNSCECSFSTDNQRIEGIMSCDSKTSAATIKRGYWAGYYISKQYTTPNYTNLVTGECPRQYCSNKSKPKEPRNLPNSTNNIVMKLDHLLCIPYDRTGTLCGRCRKGYAVAINSRYYNCVNCSNWLSKYGWLMLILTEYVPSTLLFSAVLFFDINLHSGTISSIVLYFQIFNSLNIYSDNDIDQLSGSDGLLKAIQFLYNIWNLEFLGMLLPPYCINQYFNTMDVLLVKYSSAFYAIILFSLFELKFCGLEKKILFLRKCCTRLKLRITRDGSTIRGLATVWTLVIAKLAFISGLILSREELNGSDASNLKIPVAWLQGNLKWGGSEHMIYGGVAIFVLTIFVFIPVTGLLCYPLVPQIAGIIQEKLKVDFSKNNKMYGPITDFLGKPFQNIKVKTLIDCLQADCKQKCRYYTSLLHFYRLAIIFVFSLTIGVETFFYNAVISVVFVIITATVQPYQKRRDNIVTILCISNIVIINLISIYLLHYNQIVTDKQYNINVKPLLTLQIILVLVPFGYFVLFAASRSWKKLKACWRHERIPTNELPHVAAEDAPLLSNINNDSDDTAYEN